MSEVQDAADFLSRFRLASFRPGQRDVIDAVLGKEDCVCIMPTGGGKSLCYQLPSIMRAGVTLVISPLIALMKDQVDALHELGLRAACINSSLQPNEQAERISQMQAGDLDLIYIAPERFRSPRFVEALRKTDIQLLAVDEAHCISEWGHDFRPDYARLGWFRERVGNPTTIALTATATPTVRDDIIKQLRLKSPRIFMAGFSRPNLSFEVTATRSAKEKGQVLREFLKQTPGSGIIYSSARKRCDEVAEIVSSAGRKAGVYHAGLLPDDRKKAHDNFMSGKTEIVVATVAFGMGIDKADVRFVVHYNMPGTIESYYQEAGRAGRDGQPSRCLLIYTASDRYIQEYFIDNAYPPREVVEQVYEYLCELSDDPIERTQLDIKDDLNLAIGGEGVGACLQLLHKAKAIERLEPLQNRALLRLNSDAPNLVDLLPTTAKSQRKVLAVLQRIVGERRFEDVYFHPRSLMDAVEMELPAITRAPSGELRKLEAVDYVPPFRGRALRVCEPRRSFDKLPIDFEAYELRKQAEYAKLDEMVAYATTRHCRQLQILRYFGDDAQQACGNCDRCGRQQKTSAAPPAQEQSADSRDKITRTVRIALAGVARTESRIGKQMIAQMLSGSKASKITKLKLHQLSTFGLLKHLKQSEIMSLLDALLQAQLIEQHEVQRYRPVLRLTDFGREVMNERRELPTNLGISTELHHAIAQHTFPITETASPNGPASPSSDSPFAAQDADAAEERLQSVTPSDPTLRIDSQHEPQNESSKPSYYWTWRLLSAGFRMEECCEIRRLSSAAILREAVEAVENGHPLDVRWVLTPDEIRALESGESSIASQQRAGQSLEDENGLDAARRRLFQTCLQQSVAAKARK